MAPLSGNQTLLDNMRKNFNTILDDEVAIYRPGPPVDSGDFGGDATYVLLDIVPAHYWTITGREAFALQAMNVKAEATVVVPTMTDVVETDELVYTNLETGAIHHFNVVLVWRDSGEFDMQLSVIEYKFDTQFNQT